MAAILRFSLPARKEWSPSELAEFIRAERILRSAGLPVVSESGVSDEGDPWVIFLREDTGDVIVHIAKIDGRVIAASAASGDVFTGFNFRAVMEKVVRSQPLILPAVGPGDRVHLHPSTVIIAFIATALALSLEGDLRPDGDNWKMDEDGKVALELPVGRETAPSPAGILREALLSKGELVRLGWDSPKESLSPSLVIAAALAIIAILPERPDILGGFNEAASAEALAEASEHASGLSRHGGLAEREATNVLASNLVTQDAMLNDVAQADDDLSGLPGPATGSAKEASHIDVILPDGGSIVDGLWWQRLIALGNTESHQVSRESLIAGLWTPDPAKYIDNSGSTSDAGASADKNSPVVDAADLSAIDSHLTASSSLGSTITVSAKAVELLSLLSSASLTSFFAGLTFSPVMPGGDEGYAIDRLTWHMTPHPTGALQADQAVGGLETAPVTDDSGYQLIGDILSFAFDPIRELQTTSGSMLALQETLASNLFLPSADRVLIIDLPDLNIEIFKFSDGITMMSQNAAAKLLPEMDLHAQMEIALPNGMTLKLIGIIDLGDAQGGMPNVPGQVIA